MEDFFDRISIVPGHPLGKSAAVPLESVFHPSIRGFLMYHAAKSGVSRIHVADHFKLWLITALLFCLPDKNFLHTTLFFMVYSRQLHPFLQWNMVFDT